MKNYAARWMLIGGIYSGVLVALVLLSQHGDWDSFAHIGTRLPQNDGTVFSGYDGQFAYFIAREFLNASPHLDVPAYRLQRILYPMLAWLSAGGQAQLTPVTLVGVNWLASIFGIGAFAILLKRESAPAWIPIVFVAWFGVSQTLLYDLNEIVAVTCALWAYVFWWRGRRNIAGVLFGLGALGKDMAFLFAVPIILPLLSQRDWRSAARTSAGVFVPYLAWLIFLRTTLGAWSFSAHAIEFQWIPFGGLVGTDAMLPFVIVFLILPGLIAFLYALPRWNHPYALATIVSYLFLVFLPVYSYDGSAIFRLTTPLVLSASLLFAQQRRSRWLVLLAALWSSTGIISWMVALSI